MVAATAKKLSYMAENILKTLLIKKLSNWIDIKSKEEG